jgi:hypothetical protein
VVEPDGQANADAVPAPYVDDDQDKEGNTGDAVHAARAAEGTVPVRDPDVVGQRDSFVPASEAEAVPDGSAYRYAWAEGVPAPAPERGPAIAQD